MLIYLNDNQQNDIYLTLREKSLLWTYSSITPYYLFTFKNNTTNTTIVFTAANLAPFSAQSSYDQFSIICTGLTYANYSAGTISLNPGVFWTYNVYEQLEQYNFNLANTTSCVETGKVMLCASTTNISYITASGNTDYITFNTN